MKKSAFIIFALLLARTHLYSQQDISLQNIIPPSPEASAFAKYGTYQVGTYTGRPDINIPIYDIKAGVLTVPISLNYDATGIRVNEMSSWVGMNWSLNAGGMISQMVVGQPDNPGSTAMDAVPPRASTIVNNSTYINYLESLTNGDALNPNPDGDPDKFFYSFNGRSGSFVFDRNRNVMQIPKTSIKISILSSLAGTAPGFSIVDENGITYIFTALESTEVYAYSYEGSSPVVTSAGSLYKKINTAYYMTEMISQSGDHIYFAYDNGTTVSRDDSYNETFGFYWPSSSGLIQNAHRYRWNGVQRIVSIPRLKTITFPNGKVELTRMADRQDDAALTTGSRLDEITVYEKNIRTGAGYIRLRSFKFVQGYFYSPASYGQYSGLPTQTCDRYRLRLDSLKLKDSAGQDVASYKFFYNGVQLPPKTSCSQDWWGYYNGKPNTTLVPATNVPNQVGGTTVIGSADRSPDSASMKAGSLEKIVYPTGGYTTFETQPHQLEEDFSNANFGYSATGLGLIANKHLQTDTFTTPSNLNIGSGQLNISISPYGVNDPQPFVKIKNLSTGQEQTFTSTNNTNWYSTVITYNLTANTSYVLTGSNFVTLPNSTSSITASFTGFVYDPHTVAVGGLRIKSIRNYNIDNTLAYEENYRYGANENGAGVFVGIQGNAYNYARSQKVTIPTGGTPQCFLTTYQNCNSIFSGGALFDQALIQGSPVVYTDVVKYFGTPASNSGKTAYYYGDASHQTVETRPLPSGEFLANNQGILIINDTWKKGHIISQKDYKRNSDGSYSLVQESQNNYNIVYTDTTYGLVAQCIYDKINFCSFMPQDFTDYNYADYPVYSGYVQLAQNVKKLYSQDGSASMNTTANYTYDPAHPDFNSGTTSTNSKGEMVAISKNYPFNKTAIQAAGALTSAESTAIDSMIARNMIAPVIEETHSTAGVQTTRKRSLFELMNGSIIAPSNTKFQLRSGPLETRIQYTGYDSHGNLRQQKKSDDMTQAYIWDYENALPVAEVKNADTASIGYTSFEADGSGGIYLNNSAGIVSTDAITGNKCYAINNALAKFNLDPSKTYIVSLWAKNGTPNNNGFNGSTQVVADNTSWTTGKTVNGWTYLEKKLTGVTTINVGGGGGLVDEVRVYPANAQMTTFTYEPLLGQTSQCDINNHITYYIYDPMGRLAIVKDQDGNIIKTYKYHYQGQSTAY